MSPLCSTCLSSNRRLLHIKQFEREIRCLELNINMDNCICWECHSVLRTIHRFKHQVTKAQEILKEIIATPQQNLRSLSNLSLSKKDSYDFVYHYKLKKEKNKQNESINLKNEINNEDENSCPDDVGSNNGDSDTNVGPDDTNEINISTDTSNDAVAVSKTNLNTIDDLQNPEDYFVVTRMSLQEVLAARELHKSNGWYKGSPYKCDKCLRGYYLEEKYKRHMTTQHPAKPRKHKCDICEIAFTRQDALQDHVDAHYKRYNCKLCKYEHHKRKMMVLHYHSRHMDRNKSYPCEVCGMVFNKSSAVRYHKDITHKELPKCDICGGSYRTKHNLREHIKTHNTDKREREKCTICHKTYINVKKHMYSVHKASPKELTYCVECDMQFKSVQCYKTHLLRTKKHRNPDTLKYQCSHCDARFYDKCNLSIHIGAKHLNTYPYHCQLCGKGYARKCGVTQHIKIVHEGVERPKDKICSYCGRGFKDNKVLQNHIRTHTGERPFVCEVCGAAFAQRVARNMHHKKLHPNTP